LLVLHHGFMEFAHGLVALVRQRGERLAQHIHEHAGDGRQKLRRQRVDRSRPFFGPELLRVLRPGRMASGQQVIERRAETVDVASLVGPLAPGLLWRHVGRRSEHLGRSVGLG